MRSEFSSDLFLLDPRVILQELIGAAALTIQSLQYHSFQKPHLDFGMRLACFNTALNVLIPSESSWRLVWTHAFEKDFHFSHRFDGIFAILRSFVCPFPKDGLIYCQSSQ